MTVHAAIQGIADDWMTDRAQMHSNLVRASRVDGDPCQSERAQQVVGADDAGHRFAAAAGPCRHLLPIALIAPHWHVDSPPGIYGAPDEGNVFLLELPIPKLPG